MKNLLFALLIAGSMAAQPVITGVSPTSAPAAGGTEITITGSGFAVCMICSPPLPPPEVYFGDTQAASVIPVDETTLRAIAPAHLPMTVGVSVRQNNGNATLDNAFTFTGAIEEAFDRVLIPLLTPPVQGAFGSRFITELTLANSSSTTSATLFGLLPICRTAVCTFTNPLEQAYGIGPNGRTGRESFEYFGTPGSFLYIPKSSPRIEANLRVYDESRSALNFGTEIPVVHYDHEFTSEPIRLLGMPLDPRFRNTLRIYSTEETQVTVEYNDTLHLIALRPGANVIEPAYAQFSNFPTGEGSVDVTVRPSAGKIWAFISVTNNETQLITTITPQL